jgi:hypothetical protein
VQTLLPKSGRHQELLLEREVLGEEGFQGFNSFSRGTKRLFRGLLEELARTSWLRMTVREGIQGMTKQELAGEFLELLDCDEFV